MPTDTSTRSVPFVGAVRSKGTAWHTPLETRSLAFGEALQGWRGGLWVNPTAIQSSYKEQLLP
jgi:hypothetical protein